MIKNIIVPAFESTADPSALEFLDLSTPPKTYKKEEAISRWKIQKREEFLNNSSRIPYCANITKISAIFTHDVGAVERGAFFHATADSCVLVDHLNKPIDMELHGESPAEKFASACRQLDPRGSEGTILAGFQPRVFAKVVGLENAQAELNRMPSTLWYDANYRDVESALLPKEADSISLKTAISRIVKRIKMTDDSRAWIANDFELGVSSPDEVLVAAMALLKLKLFDAGICVGLWHMLHTAATYGNFVKVTSPAVKKTVVKKKTRPVTEDGAAPRKKKKRRKVTT